MVKHCFRENLKEFLTDPIYIQRLARNFLQEIYRCIFNHGVGGVQYSNRNSKLRTGTMRTAFSARQLLVLYTLFLTCAFFVVKKVHTEKSVKMIDRKVPLMKGKLCVRRGLRAIFAKLKRPSSIEQTLPTRAPYNPLRLLKNAQGAIEIRNIPFAFTCKTERKKKD